MLLNNIKAKHPASQIVAMDWGRGVAVVNVAAGGTAVVHFDPTTLQINGYRQVMVGAQLATYSVRERMTQR